MGYIHTAIDRIGEEYLQCYNYDGETVKGICDYQYAFEDLQKDITDHLSEKARKRRRANDRADRLKKFLHHRDLTPEERLWLAQQHPAHLKKKTIRSREKGEKE